MFKISFETWEEDRRNIMVKLLICSYLWGSYGWVAWIHAVAELEDINWKNDDQAQSHLFILQDPSAK